MKTVITLVALMCFVSVKSQENINIKSTFYGHEEGFFYFTDDDNNNIFFEGIEAAAKEKFDITKKRFTKNSSAPAKLYPQKASMVKNIMHQSLLIWS